MLTILTRKHLIAVFDLDIYALNSKLLIYSASSDALLANQHSQRLCTKDVRIYEVILPGKTYSRVKPLS
jgi:hypothetical protein